VESVIFPLRQLNRCEVHCLIFLLVGALAIVNLKATRMKFD
jgi:hypothetical protein